MAAVCMAGCGDAGTGRQAQATTPETSTITASSFADIPGQFPQPASSTSSGNADAPVGGCVTVSGTPARAVLDVAVCTTTQATYRVIQRVITPEQCVADADRPFYYRDAQAQWTACLDLNWDPIYCINLGDIEVTKVDCDDPAATHKVKPVKVLLDTATLDGCPQGGYPHPTRRFTICTEPR